MTQANRRSFLLVLAIISLACLWLAGSHLLVVPLIESAYGGESLPIFNNIISGQAVHSVQYYVAIWKSISRNVLLVLLWAGGVLLVITRPEFQHYVATKHGRKTVLTRSLAILSAVVLLSVLSYLMLADQFLDSSGDRVLFSRLLLIWIAAHLITTAALLHRQALARMRDFFGVPTHPINLAVFRVILFGTILLSFGVSEIAWFSQIPAELRDSPLGFEWLSNHLPINVTWATISSRLFLLSCFTAMIGFFTRTSAWFTVILGYYVLGIPQLFGKVSHDHFLLWFAAILAVSRCGDVVSIDAVVSAWKRADRGVITPPAPSRIYAVPLRFVWLLIGIIYFFPGFWKWWTPGLDWALSDNLKFHLYSKWSEFGGWTPFFSLDQYPFMYKLGGMATMIFELSFLFLILFPGLRMLAVLGGLAFHNLSWAFMGIRFLGLQLCYVAFINWNALFRRLGRTLYKQEMYLIYDGNCRLCRRTIASVRVFDIFGRVTYLNAFDDEALAHHRLLWLDSAMIRTDMQAVVQSRNWGGFSAYRRLAARIPVLWPLLPFLYLWPITTIGNRTYRHVADSRGCDIVAKPSLHTEGSGAPTPRLHVLIAVGVLLLGVNAVFGVGHVVDGWPFACFPTFAGILGPERQSIMIFTVSSSGEMIPVEEYSLSAKFSTGRFKALIADILRSKDLEQRQNQLKALWQLWAEHDATLQRVNSIRFYRVTLLNSPERQSENPVNQELLFQLELQSR